MPENKLIFGIIMIITGLILFYFFVLKEYEQKKNSWGMAMFFKGLIGSLSFILIGIISLLIYFQLL